MAKNGQSYDIEQTDVIFGISVGFLLFGLLVSANHCRDLKKSSSYEALVTNNLKQRRLRSNLFMSLSLHVPFSS